MRPTRRSPRFASLGLALAVLGFQPWVTCGIACQLRLHPGQERHHGVDHQMSPCPTGSWTQTAMVPFERQTKGLPSPPLAEGLETETQPGLIADQPTPLSSWVPTFEPPPPRA